MSFFSQVAVAVAASPGILWHSQWLPWSIVKTCHALQVNLDFCNTQDRASPLPFLHGLFTSLVLSFGGTSLAAYAMGVYPSWISLTHGATIHIAVHVLLFWSPRDVVYKGYKRLPEWGKILLEGLVAVGAAISKGSAIANDGVDLVRVRLASETVTSSLLAIVVCGTLAGCGGGILADALGLRNKEWALKTPTVLKGIQVQLFSWVVSLWTTPDALMCALAALSYAVLTLPTWWKAFYAGDGAFVSHYTSGLTGVLSKEEGRLVAIVLCFVSFWFRYLLKAPGAITAGKTETGQRKSTRAKKRD